MSKVLSFGKVVVKPEDIQRLVREHKELKLPTDATRNRIPFQILRSSISRSHRR